MCGELGLTTPQRRLGLRVSYHLGADEAQVEISLNCIKFHLNGTDLVEKGDFFELVGCLSCV